MTNFEMSVEKLEKTPKTFGQIEEGSAFISQAGVIGVKKGVDWATYLPDGEMRHSLLMDATGISHSMPVTPVIRLKVMAVIA